MDELFYRQLGEISELVALVLMGDFNFPDINREYHTSMTSKYGKFLKNVVEVLSQVLIEPSRKIATLDLFFENREGIVGDVMVGVCLGRSDHEIVEFNSFGKRRENVSRVATLDFKRANFNLP